MRFKSNGILQGAKGGLFLRGHFEASFMQTSHPLLRAEGIYKHYGHIEVLRNLHFSLTEREIVSVVGPSGAGKSTMLHILGAIDRPDRGRVWYREHALETLSERQLAEFRNRHMGFVFQFHHLLPEFSALENVLMPALIGRRSEKEARNLGRDLLHLLGLSHREHHRPNQLSGGEQQRIAVARALINRPGVVLADEPSGNLDSQSSEHLHGLFFQIRDEFGTAFLIVTHNPGLADMADRKVTMQDGRLLDDTHAPTGPSPNVQPS